MAKKISFVDKIHFDSPDISSYAALVKLNEELQIQDYDYQENEKLSKEIKNGFINKQAIRKIFLKRWKEKYGKLYCYICGKDNLKESGPRNEERKRMPDNLATLDHKVAIVNGGLKYAFRNMICLCYYCNCTKGDKHLHDIQTFRMIEKY